MATIGSLAVGFLLEREGSAMSDTSCCRPKLGTCAGAAIARFLLRTRCCHTITLLMVIAAFFGAATPLKGKDADLKEIAQTLNKWRRSFVTLHVTWERRNPEEVKMFAAEHAAAGPLENVFIRSDWIWTDYGASRMENWNIAHGRAWHHYLWGCDGRRLEPFTADFTGDSPRAERPRNIQLRRMQSGKPASSLGITPLLFVYFSGSVQWLDELLAEQKGTLERYENKDGVRCALVKLAIFTDGSGPTREFRRRSMANRPP